MRFTIRALDDLPDFPAALPQVNRITKEDDYSYVFNMLCAIDEWGKSFGFANRSESDFASVLDAIDVYLNDDLDDA